MSDDDRNYLKLNASLFFYYHGQVVRLKKNAFINDTNCRPANYYYSLPIRNQLNCQCRLSYNFA